MTTTLDAVADGLQTRLKTISGLGDRVYDHVPDAVDLPAAVIQPPAIPRYATDLAHGSYEATFTVAAYVSADTPRRQVDLLRFLSPTGTQSIPAAIHADTKLGGLNVQAHCVGATPLGQERLAGEVVWGAAITVQILIS